MLCYECRTFLTLSPSNEGDVPAQQEVQGCSSSYFPDIYMGVLRHMITRHMITMSSVNFQPHSFENASLLLGVQVVEDMKPRSDYGTTIGQKTSYSKFWVCTTCPMHLMPAGVNKTCLHWQVGSKEATNNNLTPNKKLSYVWSSLRNHNGMNL